MTIESQTDFDPGTSQPCMATSRKLVVLSHHKCGTVWLRSILSDICALNGLEFFTTHHGQHSAYHQGAVSILTNSRYDNLPADRAFKPHHIVRNPLSIVLSAYYSHLSSHPTEGWPELMVQRAKLERCSREEGLALTVEFLESAHFYRQGTIGPLRALAQWDFDDQSITTTRFEDINRNAEYGVRQMLEACGFADLNYPEFDQYSFQSLANGRRIGEVDNSSHYRSGRADAWRDELPEEIVSQIKKNYADILHRFYPESL